MTPAMPDGSISVGPYRTPPSSDDEGIVAAIRDGQPEKIIGLSWTKPNFSAKGHKIVRTFDIDRKKRPGSELIPCAICGKHPKFLDGAVLWSPDQWLRVIGHVCAAKPEHFGEAQYRDLRRRRDQEELDAVALNWLHGNNAAFRPLVNVVNQLKMSAVFWERQQHTLFRQVPALAGLLEDAVKRQGGQLTVVQHLSDTRLTVANDRSAQSRYELVSLGALRGQSLLLRPRHKWVRQLESIIEALDRIPDGTGDEPVLTLIDRGGEHEVTITAGVVLRAIQQTLELAAKLVDAQQFVEPSNLSVLERWGTDTRNTVRFNVHRAPAQVTFILVDRSRATLPLMYPKMPDLISLTALATAGLQLDGLLPKRATREAEPNKAAA